MNIVDKKELVRLLNVYQNELLADERLTSIGKYVYGTKSQYNHARCIANKLSTEIGNEIESW